MVKKTSVIARDAMSSKAAVIVSRTANDFIRSSTAPSTLRAYATDIRSWKAWCKVRDRLNFPASSIDVADFLAEAASSGLTPSTLERRLAAICYVHRIQGLESPTSSERVRKTMQGIRRQVHVAQKRKLPVTADLLQTMIATCDDSLSGKRDRALLAIGFAGAFRRSELVAINFEDMTTDGKGIRIIIRVSKTDAEGHGQTIAIPNGRALRPVEALRTWLEAAKITDGPVFRRVRSGGKIGNSALSGYSVADIVKSRAQLAGLDPEQFSGHSLRVGFLTSAARAGASIFKMQEVSRHINLNSLCDYVKDAEIFQNHAGDGFL